MLKMTQKLSQNQIQNWRKHRKWKLFNYISRPKNSFRTLPQSKKQPIRAQKKLKITPKLSHNKCQNWRKHRKWKFFNYMSRPQKWSRTLLGPQSQPNRASKRQNKPEINSNSNVRIQKIIENKSCSTTSLDPKTIFEPHIEPKNNPFGL